MPEHVLDANVFIHGSRYDLALLEHPLTVPGVTAELESADAQVRFDIDDVTVREPAGDAVERVEDAAEQKAESLSDTDVALLALALERDAVLVTDDYGMQNVAEGLDIDYEPFLKEGIHEEVSWTFRCRDCGEEVEQGVDSCPVCGGDVRRVSAV